jgi:hypothetical protein
MVQYSYSTMCYDSHSDEPAVRGESPSQSIAAHIPYAEQCVLTGNLLKQNVARSETVSIEQKGLVNMSAEQNGRSSICSVLCFIKFAYGY